MGRSGSLLLLSGFNRFSIIKEDDLAFVVFPLSHSPLGPGVTL